MTDNDTLQENLLATASRLLEFESTAENRLERSHAIDFVHNFFRDAPVVLHEVENIKALSVVVTTRETKCPAIMLHGHLDVVEGGESQFHPSLRGDRLYARGAVDMKGFVAVAMHVMRDLAMLPDPPDIGLMINTDEEVGGAEGCGKLVADGWRTKLLINGDGGYGDAVTHAQKGIVQVELEARTKPGQRYAPWDGEDAPTLLVRRLNEGLQQLCPKQNDVTARNNWANTFRVLGMDVFPNGPMPPARATASVRLYWTEEGSEKALVEKIRSAFQPLSAKVKIVANRVYLPKDSPYLLTLREFWEKNLGRPIAIKADNGPSDAKWFAPLDIPIVLMRFPGAGAHTPDEWLEVSAFVPLYKTLYQFVEYYADELTRDSAKLALAELD